MIVCADLHLREESEQTIRKHVLLGLYLAALKDPQKILIILGDLWHIRYRVSVRLQNMIFGWLQSLGYDGVRVHLLPGNHDQVTATGENALEVFEALPHVTVYTRPELDGLGYWLPYRKDPAELVKTLQEWAPPLGSVIWAHVGVRGSWMNDARQDTTGVDCSVFAGFRVFSGHYHRPQANGSVTYVGSPYQTKADEAGQSKGYLVWDPSTGRAEHRAVLWGPRYHNLTIAPDGKMDLSAVRPGDEVRAIAPPNVDLGALGRDLERAGIRAVVTPQLEARQGRLGVAAGATLGQYVEAYIGQFAGQLDPAKLTAVFEEIVNPPKGE